MSKLLEARELCAFYGPTQVLFALGLEVEDGGITTLLGANGAGKTTTLRAISRLIRTEGSMRFDGRSLDACTTEEVARAGIAHAPVAAATTTATAAANTIGSNGFTS